MQFFRDLSRSAAVTKPYISRVTLGVFATYLTTGFLPAPAVASEARLLGDPQQTLPPVQPPRPASPTLQTPAAPQQTAVDAVLGQRIVPRYFDVTGVSAIPFEDVVAVLEPLAGQPITVRELAEHVNRITALYRDRGYAISFALLQQQSFAEGLVRVTVVEGYVNQVRVAGDAGTAEPRLRDLAAHIENERPLRRATLERYLNLMRTIPGLTVRPDMALPQRADGTTELVLNVERRPVSLEGGLADLGQGYQGIVTVGTNSLTPLGERVQLSSTIPVGSADVEYYRGAVDIPLNSDGLALRLDAYKYRSSPEDAELARQEIRRDVRNERASAIVSYPLILENQRSLTVSGGFYATRSVDRYTRFDDRASVTIHTDLRALQAGVRYATSTATQARSLEVNVHRGLDALGARQGATSQHDLDFTRLTASASQTFALSERVALSLSASGQYSRDDLANSERVSFGAWRFGLGYPAGEIAGDSGWGAAIETSYQQPLGLPWLSSIRPYVRADTARVYENNRQALPLADDRRLASVGVGVRLTDQRFYTLDLNVAKPVGDRALNDRGRGLRFNANYSLRYE